MQFGGGGSGLVGFLSTGTEVEFTGLSSSAVGHAVLMYGIIFQMVTGTTRGGSSDARVSGTRTS